MAADRDDDDVGGLLLQMAALVEVGDAGRAAAIVGEDFFCHALGAEFAVAGVEGDGDYGVLRAVFGVDFAGESAAPAAAHAGAAAVVRNAVAQHGEMEGMQAEALCRRLEDAEFAIRRQRRHGKIAAARAVKGRAGVVAGDADFVFGLVVEGLKVVVGDGPVFKRTAGGSAVGGAHSEVLRHVAPGLRAVAQGSAADAGCVVLIGAFAGKDGVGSSLPVDPDTGIALVFGTEGVAEKGGALVAEIVFAAVGGSVPLAALKQDDAEAGGGKFLGNDAASCASADDDCVDALHERRPCAQVVLGAAAEWWFVEAQHAPTDGVAIAAVARRAVIALHGVLADEFEEGAVLSFECDGDFELLRWRGIDEGETGAMAAEGVELIQTVAVGILMAAVMAR